MLNALLAYMSDIRGAVMPLAAVSMIAILGTAAVGVDASYWAMSKRDLQTAADAAALAAGWEVAMSTLSNADYAAHREAALNGFEESRNGSLEIDISLTEENDAIVDVILSQETDVWFAGVITGEPMRITARATALVSEVTGEFCIFGLDPAASGAVTIDGTASVNSSECGLAINSRSNTALSLTGNGTVNVDLIRIGGGYEVNGGASNLKYRQLYENQKALNDPYADLEVPYYEPCDATETKQPLKVNTNGTTRLQPGVYCGGINISGTNRVIFEPGIYIIDSGDLSVIGGGTIYGEGVSFILTSSQGNYGQVDISGSRDIYLGAPREGEPMQGVVFFQDRHAPDSSNLTNKLTGSGELIIDGVAYFPSQHLEYGGGYSTETASCTKVIGKKVTLSGTPVLNNDCENLGIKPLGMPKVQLIG